MYNYVLRFDPRQPEWPQRDVFYLSKCHACPGALCGAGAVRLLSDLDDLRRYGAWGSHLESHPDSLRTPGHRDLRRLAGPDSRRGRGPGAGHPAARPG